MRVQLPAHRFANLIGKLREESIVLYRIRSFIGQLKRYIASVATLLKDLFRFDPVLMVKVLVLSVAGTTLQGFVLGSTFYILRQLDNGMYFEVGRIFSGVDGKIHCALLLAIVLAFVGVAALLLYKSDKSAFHLSRSYANSCGAALIQRFPVVAQRIENPAVHPKTGMPIALSSELRTQSGRLEIGVRMLLKSPTAFFQVIYGGGFLLYLEPVLTLFLLVVIGPILIPLNKLIRNVKYAEKRRIDASRNMRNDLESLMHGSGRLPLGPNAVASEIQRIFDASAFAEANHYRYTRVVSAAGAQAFATSVLMVAGIVSMLYFWLFYSNEGLPIALIVVYFGALRMAAMSGRQVVARLAAFGRFYEQVQKLHVDRRQTAQQKEVSGKPPIIGITGPDLMQGCADELTIKGYGPFALIGTFPLFPINRYTVAAVLPDMNNRRRSAVVSQMMVVHENPTLNLEATWHELLGINASQDERAVSEKLNAACSVLDAHEVFQSLNESLSIRHKNATWSQPEAVEAMLLHAYFIGSPVVVAREEALEQIGIGAVKHWRRVLSDRLLFVYYQYEGQELGRWGEQYVALVDSSAREDIGVASVEWANANSRLILDALKGDEVYGEQSTEDAVWDDDEEE
jgi:hypothetical protein